LDAWTFLSNNLHDREAFQSTMLYWLWAFLTRTIHLTMRKIFSHRYHQCSLQFRNNGSPLLLLSNPSQASETRTSRLL
jgi:hypothetical protein